MTDDEGGDEEEDILPDGSPVEINQLIGKSVGRTVTKEGCGIDVVQVAVASYFIATKDVPWNVFRRGMISLNYQQVLLCVFTCFGWSTVKSGVIKFLNRLSTFI